ncbi:Folate-dependent protein for Fe/S cluster synthesis/repair in oxidative stress [Rubellimicrobium mesophilum DSM 19309]|uniref:Folate-dependent protein for Fe/S cluster synthesis/repair in oxidative stress n=1 Tax=Rubellimicrobium mesophilum DSM 19309 TaxID=442562 RepID=A0A017HPW8_9RHOB|nr:folate-binding protein YgfZ [Rubellimicrobium mesophilum]EYD76522.1 Folate-dependent protein for Fe/S cluster synthesis/repair in oxidative stress [Rubellimicrobium mesophilum DSM 19309]
MSGRTVIAIEGSDREGFLQGLVSNDLRGLKEGLVYAALLTPQGKYLADFFLVPDGERILLDVDERLALGLVQRLSMYKLRADVRLAPTDLKVRRGTGEAPEGALSDPRDPALGWRLYGPEGGDDGTDWDRLRVEHVIPETGIELTPETYILEAGFERLHGVDFRKGCYVGQEVTARMKHKTELRKGLAQVRVEGAAPVGTPILTGDGREAGTLYTQAEGLGIAHLRFDRTEGPMVAGEAQVRVSGQEGEAFGE